MDFNIVLTSNGPGEMSAWVQPMVQEIRQLLPQARIIIALVPCPHSSGQEQLFSHRFYGATVMSPKETVHYLLTGHLPPHVVMAQHGVILHLGGDQLFSVGLGWRTHFPVTVYTEKLAQWKSRVVRYYFRDQELDKKFAGRIPAAKRQVVGDLMADAVKPTSGSLDIRQKLNLRLDAPVVSLLPGSKPLKVLNTTAFMLKVVDELSLLMPQVQFILPQSPFTPLAQIRQAVQDPKYLAVLDGTPGKVVHDRNSTSLVTPQGNRIQIVPPGWHYAALQISDLSLTLPGTNTAELAALGVPMMVILPLQRPDLLPLEGLPGLIGKIPLFGKWLKSALVRYQLSKLKYLALPNQKLNQAIVPEMVGNFSAESLAAKAYELLMQPYLRREMSMRLRQTMGSEQAATHILMDLVDVLQQYDPRFSHLVAYSQSPSIPEDSDSTSSGFQRPQS